MANRTPNGRFQKGQSGNPAGRPPLGDSLAEQIRTELDPDSRKTMLGNMIQRAIGSDHDLAMKAAEWLAKHGWPEEAKGWSLQIPPGEGGPRKVVIELKDARER